MKNLDRSGFGGPEHQPPPPYSPSHAGSPPYNPSYSLVPTVAPSLGTPANADPSIGVRVPVTSAGRGFTVTIPPNGQTVTVMSYDPPPRRCTCIHGFLVVLLILATLWVLKRFFDEP